MACCSRVCCAIALLVTGLVLVLAGGGLIWAADRIARDLVRKFEVLSEGGYVFNNWVNPPVPVLMSFYLFNVTNVGELRRNPNATIRVQEIGPFAYKEHTEKVDVEFSRDGREVSYRFIRYYVLDEARSVGPDNLTIWLPNFPIISLAQIVRYQPELLRLVLDVVLSELGDGGVFMQQTAHDVIWGYEDPVLKKVKKFIPWIPDRIGIFMGQNNTDSYGSMTVFTGTSPHDKLAVIQSWNGKRNLSLWASPYGNMINGTDGSIFSPFVDKHQKLYFFLPDMCRSFYATFNNEVSFKDIDLLHWTIPEAVLASAQDNPDNAAFCTPSGHGRDCLPSGALNISVRTVVPGMVMSWPHFYLGDPVLRSRFDGLSPSAEKHQTFLDVEPLSGLVLDTATRLQLNMYLAPVEGFSQLAGWTPVILPLIWFEQKAEFTDSLAKEFKQKVRLFNLMKQGGPFGVLGLGCVCLLLGAVFYYRLRRQTQNAEENDPPSEKTGLLQASDST